MRLSPRWFLLFLLFLRGASSNAAPGPPRIPVWLLANTFHSSIVLRARDVPFAGEISGSPHPAKIAFGFGACADYIGPSTAWTIFQAIFPNKAAIHVVPIADSIGERFPNSDIVLLYLEPPQFAKLLAEINRSFAYDAAGHRIVAHAGHFPDSRFYLSSERFYFPYVCNEWVAIRLRRSGLPFFLPRAILSESLVAQASHLGLYLQRHHGEHEAY